jgi:hypothetical protein
MYVIPMHKSLRHLLILAGTSRYYDINGMTKPEGYEKEQ